MLPAWLLWRAFWPSGCWTALRLRWNWLCSAGRLDRSIVLDSADYVRIARPALHSLSGEGAD